MRAGPFLLIALVFASGCVGGTEKQDPIISLALTNNDFKTYCDGLNYGSPDISDKVVSFYYTKEASENNFIVKCVSERLGNDGFSICIKYSAEVDPTEKTIKFTNTVPETKAEKCSETTSTTEAATTTTNPTTETTATKSITTVEEALNLALSNSGFKTECDRMRQTEVFTQGQYSYSGVWKGYFAEVSKREKGVPAEFNVQCSIEVPGVYNDKVCYYARISISPNGDMVPFGKSSNSGNCPVPIQS